MTTQEAGKIGGKRSAQQFTAYWNAAGWQGAL